MTVPVRYIKLFTAFYHFLHILFKSVQTVDMKKVLIIGGGVAGLSAGIYARLNGFRAIVCERQKTAGGNLTAWKRGEYTIDNCIHWLTGTNPHSPFYRTWVELGALGNVNVYNGESLYTYEQDGKKLSLYRDIDRLENDMLELSPQDKKQIHALINAVKALQGICAVAGEAHDKKADFINLLKSAPALLHYYRLSTGELAQLFKHPLLRSFLSCFITEHFSALSLLFVFATFCGDNGGIPEGGSAAMAKRIISRFEELGGELLLGKRAVKIHQKNGKATSVSFADGTNIRADYIVCACDIQITFETLLDMPMPKALQRQYADKNAPRFSSYHCAFACDTDKLPFTGDLILPVPKNKQKLLGTSYLALREFTHEKSFAPEGKTVLQTLTFCDEQTAKDFVELRKNKQEYNSKKQKLAEAVQALIQRKFPKLTLQLLDVWTPATYERYFGAEVGSWMSFVLPKKHLPRRLPSTVSGIKNVVLATQWQMSPGGLPVAADMGKRAVQAIVRKEKRKFLLPSFPLPKRQSKKKA